MPAHTVLHAAAEPAVRMAQSVIALAGLLSATVRWPIVSQ